MPARGRTSAGSEDEWSPKQVADCLGLKPRRVTYLAEKLLRHPGDIGRGNHVRYTTSEVLALGVAQRLNDEGVKIDKLRDACLFLKEQLPNNVPLTGFSFFTDGQTVLVETEQPFAVLDVGNRGQLVFAMALHDIAIRCQAAGILRDQPPRSEITASVTFRWHNG
jgi:DNA-binding transcriptional MerR regulator